MVVNRKDYPYRFQVFFETMHFTNVIKWLITYFGPEKGNVRWRIKHTSSTDIYYFKNLEDYTLFLLVWDKKNE